MLILSTDYVPGKEIEAIGIVKSSVVQTDAKKDAKNAFDSIFGASEMNFGEVIDQSRDAITKMMEEKAQSLGADAVISVKYTTSVLSVEFLRSVELLVYGTAVKYK